MSRRYLKYLVDLVQLDLLLLIQLVYVAYFRVDEEETEAHDLDQHLLLLRREVHVVLKHMHAYVYHVTCGT